jgi:streptogramin lyase
MKRIGPLLGLTTAALLAGGLALTTPIATAAPAADGTFSVTSVGTNNQITQGPDNNMWVTLDDATKNVARITPAGVVTEFDLPGIAAPIGITAQGGNLWVTLNGAVARFDPAAPENAGTTITTPLADIADPRSIAVGPDGNLWTASGDKVLKIPPAAPATATTYAATGVTGARAISRGGDFLWVADFGGAQVVRVATDGTGTAFATGGGPQGVAGGAGGQVAYANPGSNPHTIGLINSSPPPVTVPSPLADPFGVTFANDQAYWVAQFAAENLARVTAAGALTTPISFPAGSGPRQIGSGPGDTVWVTLDTAEKVGRVTGVTSPMAPNTSITQAPKAKVTTKKAQKKLTYRFTSSVKGSTYQCRIVWKSKARPAWRTCTTPKVYKKKPGRYVFWVRASVDGQTDPTPAKRSVRVIRR